MKYIKTLIKLLIILFIFSQAAAQVHIHSCDGEFDQVSSCLLCDYLYISLSTLVLLSSGFIILLQISVAGKIVFIAPVIFVFKYILRNKAPPVFNYNFS